MLGGYRTRVFRRVGGAIKRASEVNFDRVNDEFRVVVLEILWRSMGENSVHFVSAVKWSSGARQKFNTWRSKWSAI